MKRLVFLGKKKRYLNYFDLELTLPSQKMEETNYNRPNDDDDLQYQPQNLMIRRVSNCFHIYRSFQGYQSIRIHRPMIDGFTPTGFVSRLLVLFLQLNYCVKNFSY